MIEQNKAEFEKLGLTHWHNKGFKGKGATVVVLDDTSRPHKHTGVEEPFKDSMDRIDHKTNVCSVVREIAPETRIVSFSWFGSGKTEIVQWLFDHQKEISAVNCSFTGKVDLETFDLMKDLDIPVIVSSGNQGWEDRLNTIASYPWTVSVGAWQENRDSHVSYSNAGAELDVVAFTNIYIPTSEGYSKLLMFNGTSCSAPVVCGMLAVVNGHRIQNGLKKMTRQEATEFVHGNTVDKLTTGHDFKSGHGLFVLPQTLPKVEPVAPVTPVVPKVEPVEEPFERGEAPVTEPVNKGFTDMKGHWAESAVTVVDHLGIIKGFPDGTFKPDQTVTRAEMATIVHRLLTQLNQS